MTLEAGKLRHRVVIEQPSNEQDETTGAMSPDWTEVCTVWAAIKPLSTREFIAAQAQQSKVIGKIIIRYRDDITAEMRAVHGNKIYSIEGVFPDEDSGQEYLSLVVAEGVKDE